jgi:hypothetical protein
MQIDISNFEWKLVKKRGQPTAAPVHQDMAAFKVWQQIVQISFSNLETL